MEFSHRCRCLLDKAENRQMCLYALGMRCGEGTNATAEKIPRCNVEVFFGRVPSQKRFHKQATLYQTAKCVPGIYLPH